MREKDAMTDPFTPIKARIGSGPFRFVEAEYRPGANSSTRNSPSTSPRAEPASGFAGGKGAKVDRVEWIIMPDAAVALQRCKHGEVDFLDAPPLDLLPTVAQRPQHRHRRGVADRDLRGAALQLAPSAVQQPEGAAGGGTCGQPARLHVRGLSAIRSMARMLCLLGVRQPNGTEVGSEDYRKPDLDKARQLSEGVRLRRATPSC